MWFEYFSLLAASFIVSTNGQENETAAKKVWKFGMASGGSSFFDPIHEGFLETCESLGQTEGIDVECQVFGETDETFLVDFDEATDLKPCVPQIRYMMEQNFDGISVYCGVDHPVLQEARDQGIVLSSFDIQPPVDKYPMPYVGTDNDNVGFAMARLLRLLKQVEPGETGLYYVFSFTRIPARYQAFVSEIEKFNHRPDRGHWRMVTTNLTGKPEGDNLEIGEALGEENQAMLLNRLSNHDPPPDAIIFLNQSPMRREGYVEWVQSNRQRGLDITIIGLAGDDRELQTLARRNVDGLIGQVTLDIGRLSAETLYRIKNEELAEDSVEEIFTNLINYNLVPDQLPQLDVEQNLLGDLKVFGFVCFSLVACFGLACVAWTFVHRQGAVVRSSQPMFLVMTACGVLLMASAIIPLSFDAGDDEDVSDTWAVGICMSIPWLATIGFSVTFSALFAKTWRVNKFFHSKNKFARIHVRERDVLAPFTAVLSLNILVLVIWTVVDPLTYTRLYEDGTDLYNREIASTGTCRADHAWAFLGPITAINLSVLVIACWQVYNARNIKSEFSEATYIALAVFSLAQAFVTGIPVVAVVKDDPEAFYLVLTCVLFVLSMVILLLIFLPKFLMQRKYSKMTPAEQRKSLAVSVRASTLSKRSSLLNPSPISGLTPPAAGSYKATPAGGELQPVKEASSKDGINGSEGAVDGTMSSTDHFSSDKQYGSMVEKIDDVFEEKVSTYAPEDMERELSAAEDKVSSTVRSSSDVGSAPYL